MSEIQNDQEKKICIKKVRSTFTKWNWITLSTWQYSQLTTGIPVYNRMKHNWISNLLYILRNKCSLLMHCPYMEWISWAYSKQFDNEVFVWPTLSTELGADFMNLLQSGLVHRSKDLTKTLISCRRRFEVSASVVSFGHSSHKSRLGSAITKQERMGGLFWAD